MKSSLKKINTEKSYYLIFTLFIFMSAIFCGHTRSNNLFHLSALLFIVVLSTNKEFRHHLLADKNYLWGIFLSFTYLLFLSLSNLWGVDPKNTVSALTHSLYLIIFISMTVSVYNSKYRLYMLNAAISGFLILAIYLIFIDYQNLLTSRMTSIHSPGPTNVIDVGGYFAIGVLLSFIAFKRTKKYIYLYAALFLFISLLLTQSRGPLIALIISLIATSHHQLINRKNLLYSALALIVTVILLSYIGLAEIIVKRFQELSTQVFLRTSIWQHSFEIIKGAPFFGYGFEKELDFTNYSGEHITTTHSLYLGILLKGGIVGLILFLCLIIYGFMQALAFIKHERRLEAALFFFTLIFYLSQGMFNIGNPSEAWYLFWFPLAVIISGHVAPERCR